MELCKVCIEQHTGGCGIETWDNARVRKWFLDRTFLTEEEKTKLDQVTGVILVGLQENAYIAEFGGLRGRFIYQEVCLAAGTAIGAEKENIEPQCRSLKGQSGRLYCTGTHVFDLNNTIIGDGKVNSCCIMKDLPVVIKWRKHDLSSQKIHDVYLHHNREYEALRRLWIAGEASRIIKVYDRGLDTDWKLPFLVLELVPFAEALAPRILADIPLYLMKILQGVAFCHAHDITHHDLKEDNILWQPETKEMKLIDFDLAKVPNMPHSPCSATKGYLAPEIALCRGKCSPKVDLWSVGVIVFDVLFGVRPSDNDIMYTFALEWLPKLVASHPNTIHLKHFYITLESWIQTGLLRRIEKESCQALHTAEAFQLLGGLLAFKPEDRLSAEAALCSPFFSHLL